MTDDVHHPTHYTSNPSGVEVIEITRSMLSNEANMFKYVARCDLKGDAIESLEKAKKYNEFVDDTEIASVPTSNRDGLAKFIAAETDPVKAVLFKIIALDHSTAERAFVIEYLIDSLITVRDALLPPTPKKVVKRKR
jgi:hypothetical protein